MRFAFASRHSFQWTVTKIQLPNCNMNDTSLTTINFATLQISKSIHIYIYRERERQRHAMQWNAAIQPCMHPYTCSLSPNKIVQVNHVSVRPSMVGLLFIVPFDTIATLTYTMYLLLVKQFLVPFSFRLFYCPCHPRRCDGGTAANFTVGAVAVVVVSLRCR